MSLVIIPAETVKFWRNETDEPSTLFVIAVVVVPKGEEKP